MARWTYKLSLRLRSLFRIGKAAQDLHPDSMRCNVVSAGTEHHNPTVRSA